MVMTMLYKDENRVASAGNTGPPIPMEYYPAPAHGPLHHGPGYNQAMTNAVVIQQVVKYIMNIKYTL